MMNREVEIREGRELFANFIKEELESKGVTEDLDPSLRSQSGFSSFSSTPLGYSSRQSIQNGRELKQLSNEFSKHQERLEIKRKAEKVNLSNINKRKYFELLQEIFEKGANRKNLLGLFYFCADMIFRAAIRGMKEACRDLFQWSLEYVGQDVSNWVIEHGGWGKVLGNVWKSTSTPVKVIAVSMILLGVGAVAVIAAYVYSAVYKQ